MMSNKKTIVFLVLAVLVLFLFWKYFINRPRVITATLPDGRVVTVFKSSRVQTKDKMEKVPAVVRGRVDVEKSTLSSTHGTDFVVIRADDGQVYTVANVPFINGLRFDFMGKNVELKGFWYGTKNIRGKEYKTIFINSMSSMDAKTAAEKNQTKPAKSK